MKHLLIITLSLIIFSCSSDDNVTTSSNDQDISNNGTITGEINTGLLNNTKWNIEALYFNDVRAKENDEHFGCLIKTGIQKFTDKLLTKTSDCENIDNSVTYPYEVINDSIFITQELGRTPGIIHELSNDKFSFSVYDSLWAKKLNNETGVEEIISTTPVTIKYDLTPVNE